VGIVRRGNPDHPNDANRSLPDDLVLPFEGLSLDPAATGAKDFRETAEIIQGLEAVVSVDTAIAHLSGALGKPCLLLLPAIGCDWRWMARRQDSPWYDSLRLVRQAEPGRWEAPLAEAADWLTKRLG
jgi:ADP-heptose:LPS heptosyltransferase